MLLASGHHNNREQTDKTCLDKLGVVVGGKAVNSQAFGSFRS